MRMLRDSPTEAVDAWSPAPPPLHMPWWGSFGTTDEDLQKEAAGWSKRDLDARIHSGLLIVGLGLVAWILCQVLTFVLDGGCTEDAAPAPAQAAAAAVTTAAAGGPAPATDAWLKKRGLRRIPVVVYEVKPGASATDDDCVICLGEFDDGDKVCVLPRCHHSFHVQCIDPWLAKHPSCPTCRDSLLI